MEELFLSQEQYDQLKKELEAAERKLARAREAIGEAAEKGDLSENAEYDAAREDEALFLSHTQEIRSKLNRARILKKNPSFSGAVTIGTKTVVEDLDSGEQETFYIVGAGSFDYAKGEIPYNGPLGKGLCEKKCGEIAEIAVPAGVLRYKILSVEQG